MLTTQAASCMHRARQRVDNVPQKRTRAALREDASMAETRSREIRLKNRPVGLPQESDFDLVTVPVPDPGAGEVLVRNLYMSVDPYMRGRMLDAINDRLLPLHLASGNPGPHIGIELRLPVKMVRDDKTPECQPLSDREAQVPRPGRRCRLVVV